MTHDLLLPFEQFLAQSRSLLDMARAGEWESFETLLAKREQGIAALGSDELLAAVAQAGVAEEMRDLLAEIRLTNDLIGEVAESSRVELGKQLRQIAHAEKAIDAYKK